MPDSRLAGSRIRQQRLTQGIKQSHLAKQVGISPAYLNLIEHNNRRIGGKLLSDIADILDVETSTLAQGAEAGLIVSMRDAAEQANDTVAELDRAEEFAGRYPGWASLIASQHRRIEDLENTVAALSDRMAHDPNLAASLHELLSTVTAINATSAILVETEQIESEWRDRFHRNIFEDSQRLADGAQGLVSYLETVGSQDQIATTVQEQLEFWLSSRDFHIAELEGPGTVAAGTLLQETPALRSPGAIETARQLLETYQTDARRMPLGDFSDAAEACGYDPAQLAAGFHTDLASVLRRLATLPTPEKGGRIGLVTCDGSGALTFRKPTDGFALPRLGSPCPLWPLYQALRQPLTPVRNVVEVAGKNAVRFLTYAIAQPVGAVGFDAVPNIQATMLILPADRVAMPAAPAVSIGTQCRICPKPACNARREASILTGDR